VATKYTEINNQWQIHDFEEEEVRYVGINPKRSMQGSLQHLKCGVPGVFEEG